MFPTYCVKETIREVNCQNSSNKFSLLLSIEKSKIKFQARENQKCSFPKQTSTVVHTYNPSIQVAETGSSETQGQPMLQSELQDNLCYIMRSCLKSKSRNESSHCAVSFSCSRLPCCSFTCYDVGGQRNQSQDMGSALMKQFWLPA